jgi:hypothetical protein
MTTQFKTTLGLTNEGGAYVFPLVLNSEVSAPHKQTKVLLHSTRLGTDRTLTFNTTRQAAQFIELMNDSVYFEARILTNK